MFTKDLWAALGRMVFVYGSLTWDKPFLAPLFSFLSVHSQDAYVELPLYVKIVIEWLRDRLVLRRRHPLRQRRKLSAALMRVDAKAEGLCVGIGGWAPVYTPEGTIDKSRSPWFSLKLEESVAPWAFARGLPARAISTLELLATTVGLVLLAPPELEAGPGDGMTHVAGLTDS